MIDNKGGCCIARCNGGAGGHDMSKVDLIMLRFRPIAPKPATAAAAAAGGGGGGSVSSSGSTSHGGEVRFRNRRGRKRGHFRDGNGSETKCNNSRRRKFSPSSGGSGSVSRVQTAAVTLPLLPETPDLREPQRPVGNVPIWLNFNSNILHDNHVILGTKHVIQPTAVMIAEPMRPLGSTVTVECLTDTWVDGDGLGCTDEERVMNLERDKCPGFVSDGLDRVRWTNGAYREMVGGGGGLVMVWLLLKDGVVLPRVMCRGFTGRVKVVTCGRESSSLALFCDAWRLDSGGFAWRLDINAALSLAR